MQFGSESLATIAGLSDSKASVLCASTGNIDLSEIVYGGTFIDGVTMTAAGQRFLAKNQTVPAQNGIYVVAGTGEDAVRATDCDTWDELLDSTVVVKQGTVNAATHWLCTIGSGGTLDTTDVTYTAIS